MASAVSNESSFANGNLGESGYAAPEYSSTMVSSPKGDIFGFGVMLLELGTGHKLLELNNGDETGMIRFTARNDQVDLMKPDATVILQLELVEHVEKREVRLLLTCMEFIY